MRFYRDFYDSELEASFSFLDFIQSKIPRSVGCDSSHWCLNGNGKFDIQSYYNKIQGASIPSFPWKGIWKVKVPKRVAFFMWIATHGRILTLDNLMLRGLSLANRCYMCCCNEESVDQLLLHCLSVPCLTSSFYFSELYWIGSLCGGTILFLLFWIYLIFVMFIFDLFTPVYSLCTCVSLSF